MSWKKSLARVRGFLWADRSRIGELQDEIRTHVELQTEDNIARGMAPSEARRMAMLQFGNPQLIAEDSRAMWSLPNLETILNEVRFGWRVLWKAPVFAIVAVVTLAFGIGSSTAVFTVAKSVLLRQPPYPEADRIALVWGSDGKATNRSQVSFTNTEDIRRRNRVFTSIANYADWTPTLSGYGDTERLAATQVSDGFFDVIGVKPALGRPFTPEENIDGQDRVVVLSDELWRTRFNADPSIIGRAITLSSVPHVVVGVMPPGFEPLPTTLVQGGALYRPVGENYDDTQRRSEHLRAIARLKPGVTLQQAHADVERIARELQAEHPKEDADVHFSVADLRQDTGHEFRPSLVVMAWASAMLLLIACANVAGLLLARSSVRQTEFAMRAALGASKSRLIRQALTESFLLALLGGVCGLCFAYVAARVAVLLAPKIGSPLAHVALDPVVYAFGGLIVVATTLVFGLVPALQAVRLNLVTALKQGAQSTEMSRAGRSFQSAIVVGELALALAVMCMAVLLVQTFIRFQRVDVGFQPENRIAMNAWLPSAKYRQPQSQIVFYQELLRRVSRLPGVHGVAMTHNPPMRDFDGRAALPEGRADIPQNLLSPQMYFITSDYLKVMGIPLLRGRAFTEADNSAGPPVAIVSQSFAEKIFPGQDPIGHKIQLQSGERIDGKYLWRTIVGVVGDVRHFGPDAPLADGLYVPALQFPVTWMTLLVHAEQPAAIIPSIRKEINSMDPEVAAFKIETYDEYLSNALLIRSIATKLIAGFGLAALFLASIGLYGLLAYAVSRRRREFGVRAALGARPHDLVRMVLRSGMKVLAFGLLIGIALSAAAIKIATSLISGTVTPDLTTLASSVVILVVVSLLASTIPARAAGHADPVQSLRLE